MMGIRAVVDTLSGALIAAGLKRDVSSDPASPSPGPCFRITVDGIEPSNPEQGEDEPQELLATLGVVFCAGTSGGNAADTSLILNELAEVLAGVCLKTRSKAVRFEWHGAKTFVGAGGLTKSGSTVSAYY